MISEDYIGLLSLLVSNSPRRESTAQMPEDFALGVDAFVRSVGINKSTAHSLFLGAGASASSGVPSAASCIWEWKCAIFLTNNPGLEAQFSELSLPAVRLRIQRWLAPEEYSF